MRDDGAAEPPGEDAREFAAPLVDAHAARVTPVVRSDVVGFIHGHHGVPAKRGPSVMSYEAFGRVLRRSSLCGLVPSRVHLDRSPRTLKAMCLRVFILSDKPLPDGVRTRGCSVDSVQPASEWKAFSSSLAHAAEFTVGGCGCALIASAAHGRAAGCGRSTSACQLLRAVLDRALDDRCRLRLLIAWAGRELDAPTAIGDITVGDVAEGRLPLSGCVSGAPLTGRVVAPTQLTRALKSSR